MNLDAWLPTPGVDLEPHAWTAVREVDRNVAIAAGPGAGKTELLAQRASYLFETGACPPPQRILAVSFKVDAATNLRARVADRCAPGAARRFDSYTFHGFARTVIARHRESVAKRVPPNFTVGRGRTATQLAYSELLPLALHILDDDHRAAAILRQAYSFAFFDEFQDCTRQQFELIEKVFGDSNIRTTAVGDSKQRIMGWAGALDDAMEDYLTRFAALELPIYQNHRSLLRLRRVQNAVVRMMDPDAAIPDRELTSSTAEELASDGEVHVLGFATATHEAIELCRHITDDIEEGTSPSEIAILTTHEPDRIGEELVQRLADRGVPVRGEQSAQDAFGEPVGELILDMARLVCIGHAPGEYTRIGEFMTRYCVDEKQADRRRRRFDRFLNQTRSSIATGALDLVEASQFRDTMYAFLRICHRQFLSRLSVEYTDDLALTAAAETAISVICDVIAKSDTPQTAMSRLSHEDAVRLLTVHKSKGLEFDNVYFVAMEEQSFFDGITEGRPTYFVGISRARSKLTLSYVGERNLLSPSPHWWRTNRAPAEEFLKYAAQQQSTLE